MMSELEQAIHRQGIDPRDVPCAWKVRKGLEERIAQQGGPGVIDRQLVSDHRVNSLKINELIS